MVRFSLFVAACAVVTIVGCERAVTRERTSAAALVDSVAGLTAVERYAAAQVQQARAAIVRGDSFRAAGNEERARAGYAEAVIYARLAVVNAQAAPIPTTVTKDSL